MEPNFLCISDAEGRCILSQRDIQSLSLNKIKLYLREKISWDFSTLKDQIKISTWYSSHPLFMSIPVSMWSPIVIGQRPMGDRPIP